MKYWTGCSGWQYPEWKKAFYPADLPSSQWLLFYAEKFNTVEINSSFYRFPTEKTLEKWKQLAPADFCYSLKANRSITHYHKFQHTQEIIKDFYKLSDLLEEKLGCILFQLPRNIHYDLNFLYNMINQLSTDKKNVIEFRHESWWRDEVLEKLNNKGIIFVNVDSPMTHVPFQPTGETVYLRLHGHYKWYQDLYGAEFLKSWVDDIKKTKAKEVWCYFDNTMDASAIIDAITWQKLTVNR